MFIALSLSLYPILDVQTRNDKCPNTIISLWIVFFRCNDVHLPPSKLAHVVAGEFSQASQVLNSIAYLKNLSEEGNNQSDVIDHAVILLKSVLSDLEEEHQRKLSFIIEQMELLLKEPRRRRYSSFTIACAIMWQNTSAALYNQLLGEGILTLPAVGYLKQLSSALAVETGLSQSTMNYLKRRATNLSAREKMVTVILDEVYCAKRVEFAGGKVFGLEGESASKTLLCFMITSIAGRYRDMVAMHPISKIDFQVIEKNFLQVLGAVTDIGFDVVGVSTDGHSSNRKFYEQLCGGKIAPFMSHPKVPGEKIHLLFDPVHLFKNYFTNFLNHTIFTPPDFKNKPVSANFNHVSQLYHHELRKPVKLAHKLTQKVLSPRPIERCNVMLADRLFHESTIAALRFYAKIGENPDWGKTANFLEVIRTWWNIINVRTTSAGWRKRDEQRKPIFGTDCDQIQFMNSFGSWLREWQGMGNKKESLSRETFFCAIQTTTAIPKLVDHLLKKKSLSYVLLGKMNSDPIERRFGHYRQLAGANYFLSVRQFLEAEKSIRIRALVKYSNLVMSEITELTSGNEDAQLQQQVEAVLSLIEDKSLEIQETEEGDESIVYFVAGYIAKGLLKKTKYKCQLCIQLISESDDMPPILFAEETEDFQMERARFLNQVNRGGLIKPSDLLFLICLHAHQLHKVLFCEDEIKNTFLSHLPRAVFSEVLKKKLLENHETRNLVDVKCSMDHNLSGMVTHAAKVFCNCMLKNYVSEVNDKLHEGRKRNATGKDSKAERKIAKLQGKK